MLDLAMPVLTECPRCKGGRTWLQPKTGEIQEARAVLYHCCGDGKKLTARIVQPTEAEAVSAWNESRFEWVQWARGDVVR